MRLTKNLHKTIAKMHALNIPKAERREFIKTAYSCIGKFRLYPQGLNGELEYLIDKKVTPEQAVDDIQNYFRCIRMATFNFN